MDTLSSNETRSVSEWRRDSVPSSEERPQSDCTEKERLMLTTAGSINSLETRPGDVDDGSSLKHMVYEELHRRRVTVMSAFQIGPVVASRPDSSRPSTDMSGYKGKTPVPFVIEQIVSKRGDELYRMASEALEKGDYLTTISHLTKAIVLNPDNHDFFVLRGEAYLLVSDFQSALSNYRRACILQPENEKLFRRLAFLYYLQGQTFFDEEDYGDALECFSKAVEIEPDSLGFHMRCIACLAALQRHGECLALVNKRLEIEKTNADLYVMRARIHDTFRNDSLCYFDVADALKLEPSHTEAKEMLIAIQKRAELFRSQAMKFDLIGKKDASIAKISSAIEVNPSSPELHVYRSSLLRRNHEFVAAVDDLLLAMDKTKHDQNHSVYKQAQKQLLITYNDFAVDCFTKQYYEEAITLLNKAIKNEKADKTLYKNRGDCFYRTKELHFALSDYLQALDIDESDDSVKCKLANVYNDLGIMEYNGGNYQQAEEFFSVAISYNPSVSSFYASRARSRYMLKNQEDAKIDVLSALCLDSNNKEVMSLFARIFPGKSVAEVLTTQLGEAVKMALTAVIADVAGEARDASSPFSSKNVLPGIKKASKGHDATSDGEVLRICIRYEDIKANVIKEKRKVNELVSSVVHSRQNLTYTGPRVQESQLLAIELPPWVDRLKEEDKPSRKVKTRSKETNNTKNNDKCQNPKPITFLKA